VDGISCDACGAGLLIESEVRYLVKIEVYAAYDPLELTGQDLSRDHRANMAQLIESMKGMDPRELEDQVYKKFQFDLCPVCQREYLKDPLRFTPPTRKREQG
jgi:CRISPR/Cas system-associated protein Cas7 (RAMP superfamily)